MELVLPGNSLSKDFKKLSIGDFLRNKCLKKYYPTLTMRNFSIHNFLMGFVKHISSQNP
jgi:hypothetical protein